MYILDYLLSISTNLIMFICIFKIESKLEHFFFSSKKNDAVVFEEKKSLAYFKYSIKALCVIGAIELSIKKYQISYIGLILVVIGVALRIFAIKQLGDFWSFNIKIFKNHKIINTSLYHYLRHPAYIGNVYIVGLFLFFCCYLCSAIALLIILFFGYWRSKKEEYLLKLYCYET